MVLLPAVIGREKIVVASLWYIYSDRTEEQGILVTQFKTVEHFSELK
jgi:hypothetical protein